MIMVPVHVYIIKLRCLLKMHSAYTHPLYCMVCLEEICMCGGVETNVFL